MTKKRKSGGRSGGSRGNKGNVQCSNCGRQVPADKIKKVTRYISVVDPSMRKELQDAGAVLPRRKETSTFLRVMCNSLQAGKNPLKSQ